MITRLLAWWAGLKTAIPAWAGYAAAALLGAGALWWVYSSGVKSGRAECEAAHLRATLAEQSRQHRANEAAFAAAERAAQTIINRESKTDALLRELDAQAGASPRAADCGLDLDGVRRINRIR